MNEDHCAQCGHPWGDHTSYGGQFCSFYVGIYERCHCTAQPEAKAVA